MSPGVMPCTYPLELLTNREREVVALEPTA